MYYKHKHLEKWTSKKKRNVTLFQTPTIYFFLMIKFKTSINKQTLGKMSLSVRMFLFKKETFQSALPTYKQKYKIYFRRFFFFHIWNKVNIFIFSLWLKSKRVLQQETFLKMSHIVMVFLFKKESFTQLYTGTRKKHRKISTFFFRRLFSYLEWGENLLIKTSVT